MRGPARRPGVIANPLSRALREGRCALDGADRDLPRAAPASRPALAAALADFARRGVDLLVVQGGDGTLREVLTALPGAFARPPEIAVLPAGKTNLLARALGMGGTGRMAGAGALARLREAAAAGRLRRRELPVLQVRRAGVSDPAPLRGLLFGAGAFTEAKLLAERRLHRSGIHDRLAVALALGGVALGSMRRGASRLEEGVEASLARDGTPGPEGRRFLLLATSLDRLMLGLWPFADRGEGRVNWLDVAAPPRRLPAALWAARRGWPRPWMEEAGYRSGRATHLAIGLRDPFVLDGELFEPGPEGVELSASERVAFVLP